MISTLKLEGQLILHQHKQLICRPVREGLGRKDQPKIVPTIAVQQLQETKLNMAWMPLQPMKEWFAKIRSQRAHRMRT